MHQTDDNCRLSSPVESLGIVEEQLDSKPWEAEALWAWNGQHDREITALLPGRGQTHTHWTLQGLEPHQGGEGQ